MDRSCRCGSPGYLDHSIEDGPHVAFVDEPHARSGLSEDLPTEGVNGSDEGAPGGSCPLPQLCRRLGVVRKCTDR